MPKYKLTYFNVRARGEPIRVIFKLANVEYDEVTIPWASEEWAKLKKGKSNIDIFLPRNRKRSGSLSYQRVISSVRVCKTPHQEKCLDR